MSGIGVYPYSYPAKYGSSTSFSDHLANFSKSILPSIRLTLREASTNFDEEIISYIEGCVIDLISVRVLPKYFESLNSGWKCDPQILQACRWYALSKYGLYNADMEKYEKAYSSLKATIATQARYTGA